MALFNINPLLCILLISTSITTTFAEDYTRDSRSIEHGDLGRFDDGSQTSNGKSIQRLVGGHVKNTPDRAEILRMESAGGGKNKRKEDVDEEKKTLSQQVAEGKYGLIQKELFSKPPKSPGIISYRGNSEVPSDNENNLGGLQAGEIWLAEDHLLVLKGGVFPEHNSKENDGPHWPPIDNYKAPRRQVKIPANPKIPPPFPVQLHENGPIEFIGSNGSTQRVPQDFGPPYYTDNSETPFPIPQYGAPLPGNSSQGNGPLPFPYPQLPPQVKQIPEQPSPPFIASYPPGAVYLPPPTNQTDFYDEDDPSIYYPPPYSFFYPKDNSSAVPPGPLVPGIILPPPPDFFAPLDNEKKVSHSTTKAPGKYTIKNSTTTTEHYVHVYPTRTKVTPKPPVHSTLTPSILDVPEKVQLNIPSNVVDSPDNNLLPITTPVPQILTPLPPRIKAKKPLYYTTERGVSVASYNLNSGTPPKKKGHSPRPNVPSTTPLQYENYYEQNTVSPSPRPFAVYGPPEKKYRQNSRPTYVSTTSIPLKAYFTSNIVETTSDKIDPYIDYQQRQSGLSRRQQPKLNPKPQAEFYYYEEGPRTTSTPQYNQQYYEEEIKQPRPQYYSPPARNHPPPQQEQIYYIREKPPTRAKPEQYQYYDTTLKPDILSRLHHEIQLYLTSPKFKASYEQTTTPKSVYQYSFQAEDYLSKQYRDPQPNNDPFRPIVGYNNVPQTTLPPIYIYEKPTHKPNNYYTTPIPQYDYNEQVTVAPRVRPSSKRPAYSPLRISPILNIQSTPNPIDHAYYTKQEEGLLDDITKQYFTVFGQKISQDKGHVATTPLRPQIEVTTPIPHNQYSNKPSRERYIPPAPQHLNQNIEVHFGDNSQSVPNENYKHISLASDTLVNFRNPRPQYNPDSEFVPIVNPQHKPNQISTDQEYISLESDIAVNNKYPRPPINPHAEIINTGKLTQTGNIRQPYNPNSELYEPVDQQKQHYRPNPNGESIENFDEAPNKNTKVVGNTYIQQQSIDASQIRNQPTYDNRNAPLRNQQDNSQAAYAVYDTTGKGNYQGEGQPGSFVSYQLPGNGAHFYFLTPQAVLAQQKQGINSGYQYAEPNQRLRRSRFRQREQQQNTNR